MSQDTWSAVDHYIEGALVDDDDALRGALRRSQQGGLPAINVAPNQGKLLHLLARMVGAKTILEVGTLGGYSTIWMARAIGNGVGGRLVTLEIDPKHAEVARANLEAAGVADRAEVWVGPALDTLPQLVDEGFGPIDLAFIDADKPNNAAYFSWALRLAHPGTVIVVDNVVRDGHVVDDSGRDPNVEGARAVFDLVSNEPRVDATALQTVGIKGYDGLIVALVTT